MTTTPQASVPYDPFRIVDPTTVALASDLPFVNVKSTPYNATGDGVTDDVTALQAAIDAAYAAGGVKAIVWVPAGTFIIGAALNLKCQMIGVGTIKTKTGNTVTQSLTIPTGYDGAGIAGISVDGNLTGNSEATYAGTYGLLVKSNNVTVTGVKVRNTFGPAIYVGLSNVTRLSGVRILNNYLATGRSRESGVGQLAYADGIQTEWTDGIVIRDNVIDDFMRGGIVIEGDTTLQSRKSIIANNLISNMTGAGSGGQVNYGVWCENSLGALISGNIITNAGRGINLSPTNGASEAYFDLIANEIFASNRPSIVIGGPTGAKTRVNVIGGSIQGQVTGAVTNNQAILISGAGGDILIDAVHFGAVTFQNNSTAGLIVIDVTASTNPVRSLTVRNCTHETSTYPSTDSGDINIVSTGGATGNLQALYLFDNPGSWSMVTQQTGTVMRARNTVLTRPSATYLALNATTADASMGYGAAIYTVNGGASANVSAEDTVILASYGSGAGSINFVITANQPRGRVLIFKDYSGTAATHNIVITATGQTIDGAASKTINSNGGSLKIQNVDGTYQTIP